MSADARRPSPTHHRAAAAIREVIGAPGVTGVLRARPVRELAGVRAALAATVASVFGAVLIST